VHPQEALLQAARAYQQTPEGRAHLRERVVVEHRLARLGQLGIGQTRYIGRAKTRFQLLMAATIANLRRTWNRQQARNASKRPSSELPPAPNAVRSVAQAALRLIERTARFLRASPTTFSTSGSGRAELTVIGKRFTPKRPFQPHF
jgi:hypothetical protein